MKKSKIIIAAMFALSAVFQAIYFNGGYKNMFAIGLDKTYQTFDVALTLIYVLIPVLFIMFYMGGSFLDLTQGYGKLLIIRNYSKSLLILKNMLKIAATAVVFTAYQMLVWLIINRNGISVNGTAKAVVMYCITLLAVILLECLLELYIEPQIVNIFLFVYSFVSYFIVQVLPEEILPKAAKILLFPSLMFGMQNGAADGGSEYYMYLAAVVIIILILALLSIRKFKKTDIF